VTYPAAVSGRSPLNGGLAERARAWHHAAHRAVCDVIEPWTHGTVVRATRYPSYWDFNVVRVEEEPKLSVEALAAFADEALTGLAHRRLDLEQTGWAEALRVGFEALGWQTGRSVWMRHVAPAPSVPAIEVERVPYEAVNDLRVAWHAEDFPDDPMGDYLVEAREVALLRDAEVFAVLEAGKPVAFAQLASDGRSAEIELVYVSPGHRGNGLGTALTTAAITAAGDVQDLWIVADDEGRPKQLYSRLGFRPAWRAIEALRLL
jgi:GNAT superfamily N-acetyltransferase